jgi:16S rRNA A1518/A1519 N6-dimethyltransferase RsmA/KsgA/DIM1 with predicted DNA glycosylase/AP lyase activity
MCQRLCSVKNMFEIQSKAFIPEPKVTATVVKLEPRENPIGRNVNYETFENIIKKMFGGRRKTLTNSLSDGFDIKTEEQKSDFEIFTKMMKENNLDMTSRPHQLGIEQLVEVSSLFQRHYLAKNKNNIERK